MRRQLLWATILHGCSFQNDNIGHLITINSVIPLSVPFHFLWIIYYNSFHDIFIFSTIIHSPRLALEKPIFHLKHFPKIPATLVFVERNIGLAIVKSNYNEPLHFIYSSLSRRYCVTWYLIRLKSSNGQMEKDSFFFLSNTWW